MTKKQWHVEALCVADAELCTFSCDGWSTRAMQSVYGFLAAFPDRTVSFLEARDLSSISHTGIAIAGKL